MTAVFTTQLLAVLHNRRVEDILAGVVECPNHGGNFDCTPFCELCEGNQEMKGTN